MDEKKFPILFRLADKKSNQSQKIFICLNLAILVLLILSSISSIFVGESKAPYSLVLFCTACLVVSTLLNLYIFIFKPEKSWYEGRAIAESVKTLTWKFITGTKPFGIDLNQENSENLFNENLKKIIGQKKDFFVLIGKKYPDEKMISEEMLNIRFMDFEARKTIYLTARVQDQINWYSNNASRNAKFKTTAFIFMITFQFLGIGFFILELNYETTLSLTSLAITLTSIFLAWLQLKRYQELSESYAITAMELKFIKDKSKFVTDNDQLAKYVDDTENAISREHTLWLARRDNIEMYN